ncbi:cathepsin L-like proteinase [Salvia splendens]|uniref:cathepsin L-like proteinase n=1 Tax=Salvia splendens TaxID=180675 RepID=UPI001C266DE9|nr:cathepsin L-like proteinase [Salvia splendens]
MDIDQPDAHSHVGILPDKLPTSLAWHLHSNIMSPVVDQGDTLICWALATLSGIEAWSHLKYGESSKLSVQELLNCKEPKMYGREDVDIHKFYTGSILDAFNWIESKGIQLQKDYEWEGVLGECKPKQMKWNGIDLDGHKTVSIDEESMLIALNKGPVVGAVLFDRSIDECGKETRRRIGGFGGIARYSSAPQGYDRDARLAQQHRRFLRSARIEGAARRCGGGAAP